jgi:hypothetical protein
MDSTGDHTKSFSIRIILNQTQAIRYQERGSPSSFGHCAITAKHVCFETKKFALTGLDFRGSRKIQFVIPSALARDPQHFPDIGAKKFPVKHRLICN